MGRGDRRVEVFLSAPELPIDDKTKLWKGEVEDMRYPEVCHSWTERKKTGVRTKPSRFRDTAACHKLFESTTECIVVILALKKVVSTVSLIVAAEETAPVIDE